MSESSDSQPTLKVMRLYKPKLHLAMPVPCGSTDDAMPICKEPSFSLSNFFILPDSFGNIYLGETFCSYISVLNQFPYALANVGLTAQLQTPNGRSDLIDVRARRGETLPQNPAVVFKPGSSLDMVVEHALEELGVHTLRVGVTFTERETGDAKSLRKLYRFNVTSPLTITFRHETLAGAAAVIIVEAQVRNTTNSQLLLDQVQFLPQAPFVVKDLNKNTQPEALGANAFVRVDGVLQFIYQLSCSPEYSRQAQEVTDLGRLVVQWRTAMGESGRMSSQSVVRKLPERREVEVTISGIPSTLRLGKPFFATCTIHNHTNRHMNLQLQVRRDMMVGVFICNLAFQNLGEVPSHSTKTCQVELLPLVAGMHELKGFIIEDLGTFKKYKQAKLCDVYVEQDGESMFHGERPDAAETSASVKADANAAMASTPAAAAAAATAAKDGKADRPAEAGTGAGAGAEAVAVAEDKAVEAEAEAETSPSAQVAEATTETEAASESEPVASEPEPVAAAASAAPELASSTTKPVVPPEAPAPANDTVPAAPEDAGASAGAGAGEEQAAAAEPGAQAGAKA